MIAALMIIATLVGDVPAPHAADVFTGLTGHCYKADMPAGASDTHCFTETVGGRAVMDIHKVRKGVDVVYEGVTIYRDAGHAGVLDYAYYNSDGDLLPGFAYRLGDDIRFPETADVTTVPGLVWHMTADGYDVIVAGNAVRHFVLVGPSGDAGF